MTFGRNRIFVTMLAPLLLAVGCSTPPPSPASAAAQQATAARVLRICADPNNLPFTNEKLQGFENRIAELIADDLDAQLEYTWWAQRRGFIRNTLRTGECDLVLGIPTSFELAQSTRPYYRSTYVFVTRADRNFEIDSFDDPDLRTLRVGVHLIGDDGANAPPAHALANRGIVGNVRGYTVYGDYREPDPPARLLDALVRDEIDVAVVWGPLAGFYALRHPDVELEIANVEPRIDPPFLPFVFDIGMGVRRGDDALQEEIDGILVSRRDEIDRILAEFGVPRLDRRRS